MAYPPKPITITLTAKQKQRFLSKIDRTDNPVDCWLWNGALTYNGYGIVRIMDRNYFAHRLAYFMHNPDMDQLKLVCHTCDNPRCCNPTHLFLGLSRDNQRDSVAKRRHAAAKDGYRNSGAKIDWAIADDIRDMYRHDPKPYRELVTCVANKHGIKLSMMTVARCVNGKSWVLPQAKIAGDDK